MWKWCWCRLKSGGVLIFARNLPGDRVYGKVGGVFVESLLMYLFVCVVFIVVCFIILQLLLLCS